MLRFIIFETNTQHILLNFNTSHVTVYPAVRTPKESGIVISIHPMLRFIGINADDPLTDCIFQYIPCYGLSGVIGENVTNYYYFNTSHVTVYHI